MSSNRRITPFLRKWRKKRDPTQVAGFTAMFGNRTEPGLNQREMAALLGITEGWYQKLESGRLENPTPELLESVVRVLELNEAERHTLYIYTRGEEPRQSFKPTSDVDPSTAALIRVQPWPAYISDWAWDVLMFNEAAGRDWPWMRHGVNVMVWALAYPEARMQLINWEERWAKPMASQLRLRAEADRGHDRLQAVVHEIKERDKVAARLLTDDLTTVTHPDGDRRWLYLPGHGDEEFEVIFRAYEPMGARSQRLMLVVPAAEIGAVPDIPIARTSSSVREPGRQESR
ncbi:helix-turn-helix domain-containing protein [Streptomyces sp. NPDC058657]|uniref:helix-turn-helix domain-containing protein n=1 Tax=unclassified Streptomyces TaxID=2593676 RepID=UPI0036508FAD